jgi:hypothetical protein
MLPPVNTLDKMNVGNINHGFSPLRKGDKSKVAFNANWAYWFCHVATSLRCVGRVEASDLPARSFYSKLNTRSIGVHTLMHLARVVVPSLICPATIPQFATAQV